MITMVISYQDQDVWEGMIRMADITILKHNLSPKRSFPFVEDRTANVWEIWCVFKCLCGDEKLEVSFVYLFIFDTHLITTIVLAKALYKHSSN